MPNTSHETLIKRYGEVRLYNTETAAYVTLDDLARLRMVGRKLRVEEGYTSRARFWRG
jgi:polyhydroxyalkanoate synthesis regulator protein